MVNSGSFEPDVDRNEKGEFTQPNRVAESPHSVNCMHSVSGSLCENDFATQTADSLPVSQAIEPTATKTEYKCNMSQISTIPSIKSWETQCNSEGESNVNINVSQLNTRETSIVLEDEPDDDVSDSNNQEDADDNNITHNNKCNLDNSTDRTKVSFFCSVPLEKVQNVLKSYGVIGSNKKIEKLKTNLDKEMCLYCDRSFSNSSLKQKHVDRYHTLNNNRRSSARRQKLVLQSVTTCMYCDKLNDSDYNLQQLFEHLVADHSEKYFGCRSCNSRFPNFRSYENHMLSLHNIKVEKKTYSRKSLISKLEANRQSSIENLSLEKLSVRKSTKKISENEGESVKLDSLVNKSDSLDKESATGDKQLARSKRTIKTRTEINSKDAKGEAGRSSTESSRSEANTAKPEIKDKRRTRFMKLKGKKVVSTKAAVKPNLRMTRQQSKMLENSKNTKRKAKEYSAENTKNASKYLQFQNKSYSMEFAYKYKKITDHSIDNLKISSMTFDDVFDKAFFNRVKCNIQENLANFIDGKLFKSVESENRISSFQKTWDFQGDDAAQNYGCKLSSNAVTPVVSLLTDTQFGEDIESQIEYGSKPSKKKTNSLVNNDVHYKYFTRRKYQAVLLENKQHRDLSKLDMWTQLAVKNRQQKIICEQKSEKEIVEYRKTEEYKVKVQVEELDRILNKRGPVEDLKEEAIRSVALEKLNETSAANNLDNYFDVTMILNEMLNNLFPSDSSVEVSKNETVEKCLPTTSVEQNEVSSINEEIPAMLNLRRVSKSSKESCGDQSQEDKVELTGEWARSRIYLCASCGVKMPNVKMLMDHKNLYHEQVWSQHYEFVGNQGELYRHLSIPGLGKVGELEKSGTQVCRRSDARTCTKCDKGFNCLGDLHRHLLECGGDWSWVLARKKYKYRPYGSKTRKKKRGLLKLLRSLRERKTERNSEKLKTVKKFDGPRPKPSDADTIQRMLANLPPKRSTRKIISLKDGFPRKNKNNVMTKGRTQKNQNKLVKTKPKLKKEALIKSNRPQRLLRSNSDSTFEHKFKRGRKKNSTVNITTHSIKNKKRILSNKIVPSSPPLDVEIPVINKKDNSNGKSELSTPTLKKKKNPNVAVKTGDLSARERKSSKKTSKENSNNSSRQPSPSIPELEIVEITKEELEIAKNKKEQTVEKPNTSNKKLKKKKKKKKTKLATEKNKDILIPEKSVKRGRPPIVHEPKLITKKLIGKDKSFKKVKSVTKKKLNDCSVNKIVQVDGSSHPFLGKRFKNSVEKSNDETDEPPAAEATLKLSAETESQSQNINQCSPILTETVDSIISLPIEANNSLPDDSTTNVNIIIDSSSESVNIVPEITEKIVDHKVTDVQNTETLNIIEKKPLIPLPVITKGKIKKQRGLNDCIAMLTNKLQDKTSTQQNFNSLFSNPLNESEKIVETKPLSPEPLVPNENSEDLHEKIVTERENFDNVAVLECDKNEDADTTKIFDNATAEEVTPVITDLEENEMETNDCSSSILLDLDKLETCSSEDLVKENDEVVDNINLIIADSGTDPSISNPLDLELEKDSQNISLDDLSISNSINLDMEKDNQKVNVLENNLDNMSENCIRLKEDNNKPVRNNSVTKPKLRKRQKKLKEFEAQDDILKITVEEDTEFNLPDEFSNSGKENVKDEGNKVIFKRKKIKCNNVKVVKKRRTYTRRQPIVKDELSVDKTKSEPKVIETKDIIDSDDDLPLSEFAKKVKLGLTTTNTVEKEDNPVVQDNLTTEVDSNHIDSINNDHIDTIPHIEINKKELKVKYKINKLKQIKKPGKRGRKPKNFYKQDKTELNLPNNENLLDLEPPVLEIQTKCDTPPPLLQPVLPSAKVYDFISDSEDDTFILKLGEKIRNAKTLEHKPILDDKLIEVEKPISEDKPPEDPPKLTVESEIDDSLISLTDSVSQTETESSLLSKPKVKRTKAALKKKGKGVLEKDPNIFCDICIKTFTRAENLFKHKRTLTHIAKLSELEALEAARGANKEEPEPPILENMVEDPQDSTNGFINEEASCDDEPQQESEEQDGLQLVEILSDVLTKPVENDFAKSNSFPEKILPAPADPEVKRCKSLGERKSFDSDKLEIFSPISSPPPLCNGIETHFISKLPSTADIIVEKQISLLENMIEDNRLNFNSSNLTSNEEFSNQSNSSDFSILSSPKQDITFTHNTNIITNLIKPPIDDSHLIRNTQYEEISEDSTSSHYRFEEQKSRKVLNRDEELFLECCSLLKSSSEISDLSRKPYKTTTKYFSNFELKPAEEYEWMEHKEIRKTSNDFEYSSNNYTSDVSINGNYNDISYSNSNMSNGNLNKNGQFVSQPPMFEDISTGSASSSVRSVSNVFQSFETISNMSSNDQSKHKFEFFDHRVNGDKPADWDQEETKSVAETEASLIIEDSDSQKMDPPKLTQSFITNFAVPKKTKEEKKVITKGAMKVFEGLKVSIPKEDFDMNLVLNCSPPSKQQELLNCNIIQLEQHKTEEKKITKSLSNEVRKHKQVSRKKSMKDVIKITGNKLGLKVTKKKYLPELFKEKGNKVSDDKKLHDVYDFEETQDNIDAFTKKIDILPVYHSYNNKIDDDDDDDDLFKSNDLEPAEDNSLFKSIKNGLKLSKMKSKKINITKSITKKKCMIMGRIFKNAAKTKTSDEIKNIPAIENSKIVEDYVLNCQKAHLEVNESPKERRRTEEEMNILFDNLLNEENPKVTVNDKSECESNLDKTMDHKPRQRGRHKKRPRTESPTSSDEEFSIKKIPKRHVNKKSTPSTECVINLEQELKECIGVASRKSQRKCTSGKQNVLVEYWSSDESSFEVDKHLPALPTKTDKHSPPNLSAKIDKHLSNLSTKIDKHLPNLSSKIDRHSPNLLAEVDTPSTLTKVDHQGEKETRTLSPIDDSPSEKPFCEEVVLNKSPPVFVPEEKEKKIRKKPRVSKGVNESKNASSENSQTLVSGRQKRTAVDTLYYWSSSSEDEMQNIIEVKPIREDFNEDDRPLQHGWIVGDSPKKLVTMLAQAKGKKLVDTECVKKNKKKVSSS